MVQGGGARPEMVRDMVRYTQRRCAINDAMHGAAHGAGHDAGHGVGNGAGHVADVARLLHRVHVREPCHSFGHRLRAPERRTVFADCPMIVRRGLCDD